MRYNETKRKEIYENSISLWGEMAQFDQYIEESSELIVAINKFKRQKFFGEYDGEKWVEDNLIEELADTAMCIELLIDLIGKEKVENRLDEKFDKFCGQIEKAKQKLLKK